MGWKSLQACFTWWLKHFCLLHILLSFHCWFSSEGNVGFPVFVEMDAHNLFVFSPSLHESNFENVEGEPPPVRAESVYVSIGISNCPTENIWLTVRVSGEILYFLVCRQQGCLADLSWIDPSDGVWFTVKHAYTQIMKTNNSLLIFSRPNKTSRRVHA